MVYGIGKVRRIHLSLLTTRADCELRQLCGANAGESRSAGELSFRSSFGEVDNPGEGYPQLAAVAGMSACLSSVSSTRVDG